MRSAAIAIALTMTLGLVVTAAATAAPTCPADPAPASTVNGNLIVTGTCALDHVTVTGNVTVTGAGSLNMVGGVILGSLFVQPNGTAHVGDSITAEPTKVGGSVIGDRSGFVILDARSAVVGNVSLVGLTQQVIICGSVGGSVTVSGGTANIVLPDDVCAAGGYLPKIGGPMSVSNVENSIGRVGLNGATIGGSANIVNNRVALIDIATNTVRGSLSCSANSPAPVGSGNAAARKTDQCASL